MYRVGVDVGGTFTDLFAWEEAHQDQPGRIVTAKVPTTPEDPAIGVLNALETAKIDAKDIRTFIHGTTIATNALLERKYPEPAFVTTQGFRDVLEIGRQRRQHLYDPYQTKSQPLVSRRNRLTINEKMGVDGKTVKPIPEDDARALAREIRERGISNVAVAFINSYQSGEHEKRVKSILEEEIPGVQVAISSDTSPKVRELGRFVTTAIRAAMLPVVGDYMTRLEQKLKESGSRAPLYIVKSNGGMMSSHAAKERPEELIESGPAGGVAAGVYIARLAGIESMIVTDVGGTSFEASLMEGGRGLVTDEYELEWEMPITVPMLDIRSIGAGGGSIAWIDDGGSLRVGPQSAGAVPGPACYGRGGTDPTVTDANLVLGRLSPDLGGKFSLDREAAVKAIEPLAKRLGQGVEDCAESIIRIVGENMAVAIRMTSSDRGRDPRDQTFVAFGGAGGLHAYDICRAAGIPKALVPPYAGVACAFGATTMDVRHDLESTFYSPFESLDLKALNEAYADLEKRGSELLAADGVEGDKITLERFAAMRYIGQSYEVLTQVPSGELTQESLQTITESFWKEHQREYGVHSEEFPVAVVNLRVTAIGETPKPDDDEISAALQAHHEVGEQTHKGSREVYMAGKKLQADIYNASDLQPGQSIVGPVIIEQKDGVVVIPVGATAEVDKFRNIVINLEEAK